MKHPNPVKALSLALLVALISGCSTPGTVDRTNANSTTAESVTIDSCGREVTFDTPPERILAVGSEAPALLEAAGAGERVTHYAGSLQVPFDASTQRVVEQAERIAEDSHKVSFEMILNSGVDAVIGTDITAGVDLDSLAQRLEGAGIKLVTVSGYCAGIEGRSTHNLSGFELIYRDIENYGRVFGTQDQAAASIADLRKRVTAATELVGDHAARSAVPLYVPAEGTVGSYGGQSLVSEQMELLGVENVFADVPKRYFEPSTEALTDAAPQLIFAMFLPTGSSQVETEQDVVDAVRQRPELAGIEAVSDDSALLPLNYYYTSPGPLAVDGLELLANRLSDG
ncbi:ABC transporter substrate-binding protein [Glutamicibacter endophyticus]|uniref:ABC transporter substrate-binding protein n=1 Tax=Glutamicibacter endophyticus TaxID=1522174 RepID=UPI003AF0BD16